MQLSLFSNEDLPRNYWFVRTAGGKYYREFKDKAYIAINWNDFTNLDDIIALTRRQLKNKVKEHYEDEKRPGVAAAQMQTFVGTMKKNDIVLIPNSRSREISFGIITSDAYIHPTDKIQEGECPFRKRRNIKWIKKVARVDLDPYLYSLINTHHSISSANKCSNFINRTLFDFYGNDEETHLIFNVTTHEPIKNSELRVLMNSIYGVAEIFNNAHPELSVDMDDVIFKASVNSPGPIEWVGKKKNMVFVLALLHFFVGGTLDVGPVHWETKGVIGYAMDAYKEYNDNHLKEMELTKKVLEEKLPVPKQGIQELQASNKNL